MKSRKRTDHTGTSSSARAAVPASSVTVSPPGGDPGHATIYCDRASKYARAALEEGDYRFVDDPAAADLLWLRNGYDEWFERLRPFQLLNHLPNAHALADKG